MAGHDGFQRWLRDGGWLGDDDSGLPSAGLTDLSTPDDVIAWALLVGAEFGAESVLADPAVIEELFTIWACEIRGLS